MKMKRYTKESVVNNRFYQMPKFLLEGDFKELSNDARVLYSLLRDRHDLSLENNWLNDKDEVFLIYTRENMAEMLGCSIPTARKAFKQLERFGLVEDEFQGLNKPNLIYLAEVSVENERTEKSFHAGKKKSFTQDRKNISTNDTDYNNTKEIILKYINVVAPNRADIGFYNSIFNYYFDTYKKYMGKNHPLLSKKYVKQIVDNIDVFSDEYEILKVAEWESIIDMYFNSNLDCDRNMIHFAQGEILYNRADNCKLV